MTWLLEMLLDILQGAIFAILALLAAVPCAVFVNLAVKVVGATLEFLKDMFAFSANALVGLVIAVFAAAMLMEAYDFVIDSWGLLFG